MRACTAFGRPTTTSALVGVHLSTAFDDAYPGFGTASTAAKTHHTPRLSVNSLAPLDVRHSPTASPPRWNALHRSGKPAGVLGKTQPEDKGGLGGYAHPRDRACLDRFWRIGRKSPLRYQMRESLYPNVILASLHWVAEHMEGLSGYSREPRRDDGDCHRHGDALNGGA